MGSRTVLITGASRGIGKAIADVYRARGFQVVAPTRAQLDLSDAKSVNAFIETEGVKVDVLINNAGENKIGPLDNLTEADFTRSLQVNLTAPALLSIAAAAHMRKNKWGRIVNISSIFGHVSRAGRAPYTAAKTGLLGFTRTSALEWGCDNVLVNAVCPGYIETDLTRQNNTPEQIRAIGQQLPLGRLGQPEEVARAVWFLGSDENTFITGQSLTIDGGFLAQ